MAALDWRSLSRPRPTAIALGNFDGVHLGHRRILGALREEAVRRSLDPVVLTFDPHPRHFLFPEQKAPLLTPPREKEALMRECGVDVLTLAFDAGMAAVSAEEFVSEVLIRRLHGEAFFLGPGHRFGNKARGDAELLKSFPGVKKAAVWEIAPVIDETGEIISSSSVRRHLEAGQTELANRMLGRPYRLRGQVIHGAERGRLLGFPTANLRLEDERKAYPAYGVYGGAAIFGDRRFSAVANIGFRPTLAGPKALSVEVHLLDFNEDLYDRELTFEIRHYLRPEKAFDSLDSLRRQISEDVSAWRGLSQPMIAEAG